jgi:hypothetical protein
VAESTVCWFVVREKHYWMATDSADPADPAKRTGASDLSVDLDPAELHWIAGRPSEADVAPPIRPVLG